MKKQLWLILFCSLPLFGAVQRKVFKFSFPDIPGTRWIKVEALSDSILHFETFETRGNDHDKLGPEEKSAVWISPMVDASRYSGFTGPRQWTLHDNGVETTDLRVTFDRQLRHVRYFDKIRNIDLTTLRSQDLNLDDKKIYIEKLAMKNVYGVGNLFIDDKQKADGDWIGRHWRARGHGNFRFGPDNFHEGGPSVSQLPMIYVLGDPARNGFANYGLFFDQVYRIGWDFNDITFEKSIGWKATMWGDQIRWFFFSGDSLKTLRRNFMSLVGTSPVPPKNVFGHWTSKFGYLSWDDLEREVVSLRNNDFPLEGAALDLQWFGGTIEEPSSRRMGSLEFDKTKGKEGKEKFGNPAVKIKELYDRFGIQVMPIEESYVDSQLDEFRALSNPDYRRNTAKFNQVGFEPYQASYLARRYEARTNTWHPVYVRSRPHPDYPNDPPYYHFGDENTRTWWGGGGMIDWSNPDGRRYWHQLKRHALSRMGIFNHWLDLVEPEMYYQDAHYYGLESVGLPGTRRKTEHGSIHNVYSLFMAQGIHEGYNRAENRNELIDAANRFYGKEAGKGSLFTAPPRPFILGRAGTVGFQRFGTGIWSGDTFSNFENLRSHLATQKDMSLLGIDYYSSDTGGFFHGDRSVDDATDKEIFKQWAATSSLIDNPLRPHGWGIYKTENERWWKGRFALDARGDLDSNRANVRRRYELIPYVYSLAHQAYLTSEPIYPPLVYHFQQDKNVRKNGNQKMIGPWLMMGVVAHHGEERRPMYLPEGTWIDYENHEWFTSEGRNLNHRDNPVIELKRTERVPAAELAQHPNRTFFMVPLLARAGAIIPKMFVDQHTMNVHGRRKDNTVRNELIVRVYPSEEKTTFTLFEDDGISVAYRERNPAVRTTVIEQQQSANREVITIKASQGTYLDAPQARNNRIEFITNNRRANAVQVNNQACGTQAEFTAGTKTCWFTRGPKLIQVGTGRVAVNQEKTIEITIAP